MIYTLYPVWGVSDKWQYTRTVITAIYYMQLPLKQNQFMILKGIYEHIAILYSSYTNSELVIYTTCNSNSSMG